jgi:hypothetical protein
LFSRGGINTYVFVNGAWALLPVSPDITPYHFANSQWVRAEVQSVVSRNGNYLVLTKYLADSTTKQQLDIFSFDTVLNNWKKKGSINNLTGYHLGISNDGNTCMVCDVDSAYPTLYTYIYNGSSYILTNTFKTPFASIYSHFVYPKYSSDCKKFLVATKYFDLNWNEAPGQPILQYEYVDAAWAKVDISTAVIPVVNPAYSFTTAMQVSSDGNTILNTYRIGYVTSNSVLNIPYEPNTMYLDVTQNTSTVRRLFITDENNTFYTLYL